MSKLLKLGICISHPIQYKAPLFRRLAAQPGLELRVFFFSDTGLAAKSDPYHGTTAKWDIPLLKGYHSEIMHNWWPSDAFRPWGIGPYANFSIIGKVAQCDAVVIHSYTSLSDWMAWLVARIRGIPVLFFGDMYGRANDTARQQVRRRLASKMLSGCAAVLAIGSVARDVYVNEYGIEPGRIFLAPYAVDNDFFTEASTSLRADQGVLRSMLGLKPDTPIVLCVAGMVPKKRQADLIEAVARLRAKCQLVFVGHGPLMGEIQALAKSRRVDCVFAGFINQSELPKYYAAADVFALPSLWEEFGLVVNEAMCCGLPVVASETVAATKDLVINGGNGFVFGPGDVETLSMRLGELLVSPSMRQAFGRRSQEMIREWSYNQAVQGILDALRMAVGKRA